MNKLAHWAPGGLYPVCGRVRGYLRIAGFKKEISCKRCIKALKIAAKVEKALNA